MNNAPTKYRILLITIVALAVLAGIVALPALAQPGDDNTIALPVILKPFVRAEQYKTEFDDDIEPWLAVRWQNNADFDLDHSDDCDSGHCGFLELNVPKEESYAIASPRIPGPQPPFVLEFRARLDEPQDKQQYGAVFGGDWEGGQCPGDNDDTCFNHYYEFRVRHRDEMGVTFIEYRLRRVDGHDSNNVEEGEDLIDWTRVDGRDGGDWLKWSVHYDVRGHISFKVENDELGSFAEDKTYDHAPYFGVFSRAGDNGDAMARFTSFSIAKEE